MNAQQAINRALISHFNALFGVAPVTPEQQERDRFMAALWEHGRLKFALRRLEKSPSHLDSALAVNETKATRARRQGREDEVLRLAAERARLKTLHEATEAKRVQVSRKTEALRDWIRHTLRRPW